MSTEYFEKGRGMAQRSLDLIEAMQAAAEAAQPISSRGIGCGFDFPNVPPGWRLTRPEALEARAQVLMQQAIEAMDKLADGLTEPDELPISSELRLKQKESHS